MRISVVIPTLDEACHLEHAVRSLDSKTADIEIIVTDGGSRDGTVSLARSLGTSVVTGAAGRAAQMNLGGSRSRGDVILFLHADGVLGPKALDRMVASLADPRVVGGAFRIDIEGGGLLLSTIARFSNLRARYLGAPYGDQAIFVRKSVFDDIGGFPDVPFMEDVAFVRRLRRRGKLAQVDAQVRTGARHWSRLGPVRTTLLNWSVVGLFVLGVAPDRLEPVYRRLRSRKPEVPASDKTVLSS